MRVFVTGASGFIGSAVVQELIRAGHDVLGLARSDASAGAVAAAGARVHRGDLAASCETDRIAIETLGEALAGSRRPLVVTAGTMSLAPGRVGSGDDAPDISSAAAIRVSEAAGLATAPRGVRASVVRLAPTVHGAGDRGFVPLVINVARERGVCAYVGDGLNRWPAVHRLDAAALFRLALEKAPAGSRLHGAAEEGVPVREIAEVIARCLGIPAVSQSQEEISASLGFIGNVLGADNPTSSALTRQRLGWRPVQLGLLADLEASYFGSSARAM